MSVKLRWKPLSNGRKSAYLDIYHNEERHYEFLKIYIGKVESDSKEKKALAESIRAKRELQISSEENGFIPSFKKNVDFIKYYHQYLEGYQKKDKRKVRYSLVKFKKYLGKEKLAFNKVTPAICEDFKNYLKSPQSGLSGETPFDYWARFKGVLKQAVKDGIINKIPTEGIVMKGYQSQSNKLKKNILTKEELQALANAYCGNEEVKRVFLFACFTGLGMAEIRKLTYKRVQNGKLIIFREKTGEQVINELHPVAVKLLGEIGNSEELIFKTLPSDVAIRKDLIHWVKRAGINKSISFYCGRHTFATQLLLNGANLKTVADCLGHTTTKHTLKYLNYVDVLKEEAINNLPHIDF